jgi:hypothetical protein
VYGYCYQKNPAPPELRIGLDWLKFGTPYVFGGWRDQPLRLFSQIKQALRVYEAVCAWRDKYTPTPESDKAWYATHKGTLAIINFIMSNNLTGDVKDDSRGK